MVAVPADMPVTKPLELIVAIAVLLLVHIPPVVLLDSVVVLPVQAASTPVIVPVVTVTVSDFVAYALPHTVVDV
jgi:hypothetical protein